MQNKRNRKSRKIQEKNKYILQIILNVLSKNNELKQAFEKLSASCKREYCEHISEAKREATKTKRLEKIIPMILEQKGLHDKYKNC